MLKKPHLYQTRMWRTVIWIGVVICNVSCVITPSLYQDTCEDGWVKTSLRGPCVLIGSSSTMEEARKYCHQNHAKIMSNLYGNQVYKFLYDNGIRAGWSAEFVKDGRLVKQDIKEMKTYFANEANERVDILINRDSGCTEYNISYVTTTQEQQPAEGSGASPGPNEPNILNIPKIEYELTDCSKKQPFVCSRQINTFSEIPFEESIESPGGSGTDISICPNGWLGTYTHDFCYKLFTNATTGPSADQSCLDEEGDLMKVETAAELNWSTMILNSPMYAKGKKGDLVWIKTTDEQGCRALLTTSNQTIDWDCEKQLGYICSRPVNYPSIPKGQPRLSNNTIQSATLTYIRPGLREISVPEAVLLGMSNEGLLRLSCSLPSLISQLQKLTWVKDGAYLDSFSSSNTVDLGIYYGEFRRKYSYEFRDGDSVYGALGYYWCEAVDLKTNTIKQSSKIHINILNIKIYTGSIQVNSEYIDKSSALRYNVLREWSPLVRSFNIGLNDMNGGVNTTISRFRSGGRYVDFQMFYHPVNNPDEPKDEDGILKEARDRLLRRIALVREPLFVEGEKALVKFSRTDICPETTIISNHTGVEVEYRIPETSHGQTWETDEICVVDGAPIGEIKCLGQRKYGSRWSKMAFNENCNFQESFISEVTTNLSAIAQSNFTDNVEKNLVKVQVFTSVPEELTPLDVVYTTAILDGISKTDNITQQDAINFINIINNIQSSKEEVLTEANEKVNISNKLIASLDELELRIPTNNDDGRFRLVTNKTVVEIWNLAKLKRNPIIGLSVNGDDSDPVEIFENNALSSLYEEIELIYKTTDVGILLNKQFVRRTIDEKNTTDIRLSMHILSTNNLFINDKNDTVNSKVISATLTIDRKTVVNLNGSFVTTVFFPQNVLQAKYREKYSRCVFWDFNLNNSRGGWSSEGCRYANTTEGRDVCVCDHLTNFAVLLDYYGQDYLVPHSHQLALTIITYVGLILSIIGLGLTVLTFLFFKKLREGRPQQIMFNLALAMLFSWIVFLAGIKQTGDHVGCIVVAVLLHYFIMASFVWMLMEGILQYFLFVKVLGTYVRNFMLKATIPAWGLPVIPVAIMLAIDVELYNGGETYCWMGLQGMYYGFALPLGLIILANIIIYILVTRSICSRKNLNTTGLQHSVTNIRASFCCFIILGLTWIFGFLAISDARLVFQYIFTVLNSLQGFLIFILFTARDKKVRDYWKQLFCCCKTRKTTSKVSKTTSSSNSYKDDFNFTDIRKKTSITNSDI
ncbi:uncharacterized protein LOC126832194 [Patella vulgata]|uniref:uncharacterized protein LOC126832194 n=1 Tax=Patella vulgata TaxID=6465 RepID=UPI0021803EC1|nr:uncharacterized protein LOC126832194 [Patella vulgata]